MMQPYDRVQPFPRPGFAAEEPAGAPRTGLGWAAIVATLVVAGIRFLHLALELWIRELGMPVPMLTFVLDGSFAAFFAWCAYGLIKRQALAYRLAVRVGLAVGVVHLALSAIALASDWEIIEMAMALMPGLMVTALALTGLLVIAHLVAPLLTRAAKDQVGGEMS